MLVIFHSNVNKQSLWKLNYFDNTEIQGKECCKNSFLFLRVFVQKLKHTSLVPKCQYWFSLAASLILQEQLMSIKLLSFRNKKTDRRRAASSHPFAGSKNIP